MNTEESSQLVSRCIAGDEHAIETLVRRYETGVYQLALSITNDAADANEITQETFVRALRSLSKYQEKSSFKAWLYTIAVNLSRGHLRKRRTLARLQDTLRNVLRIEIQKSAQEEDQIIQNEEEEAIWNSLNQLDQPHRTVIVLRYFHDLPVADISEILSISEGTVHSRLHNAREKLRIALAALKKEF